MLSEGCLVQEQRLYRTYELLYKPHVFSYDFGDSIHVLDERELFMVGALKAFRQSYIDCIEQSFLTHFRNGRYRFDLASEDSELQIRESGQLDIHGLADLYLTESYGGHFHPAFYMHVLSR